MSTGSSIEVLGNGVVGGGAVVGSTDVGSCDVVMMSGGQVLPLP